MDTDRPSPLGRRADYQGAYSPDLLYAMPRTEKRGEIGIEGDLPFEGCDVWTAYELSWLNPAGKPVVAIAEFRVPCTSERIVESKSVKLYLNSFAQTRLADVEDVRNILSSDLSRATSSEVTVTLLDSARFADLTLSEPPGVCVDDIDIATDTYTVEPGFLAASGDTGEGRLYSNLLRSNCPETDQPDWGTVSIHYVGPGIDPAGFLKYVVSFREHQDFHEHCVERMFTDIVDRCTPEKLTVYARYTRRGGIDINPFRSNFEAAPENVRTARQ